MVTALEAHTAEDPGRRELAPGPLRLVQDFVNTRDVEAGTDEIARPQGLRDWLRGRSLISADAAVTTAETAWAAAFREALRAILFAHHGDPIDTAALRTVNETAARAHLAPRFNSRGDYRLEPGVDGVDGALGRIVAVVAEAMEAGTWPRLKACRNDTCQWAFYDASRNRSGSWCTMAVCGNRMKSRAYRRRQQEGTAAADGSRTRKARGRRSSSATTGRTDS